MPMTGPPPCRTCAYYQPWKGSDSTRDGECREQSLPPQVSRSGSQAASDALVTRWAPVHEGEWCGRHHGFSEYLDALKAQNHPVLPAQPVSTLTVAPAQPAQPAARDRTPNPPAQPQPKPAEPAQPAAPAAKP